MSSAVAVDLRRVGWGVAGCGWVAHDHLGPALAASPTSAAVALLDLDRAAAERLREVLPGARVADGVEDFLATPGLQVVYVATPNDAHRGLAEAAAAVGKAVLVEKPLAADVADAEAIVEACAAAGVVAGTAFDQRWHPAHTKISDLVDGGVVGQVTAVRIAYGCWLPPGWSPDNWRTDPTRAGGGALVDLAPHGLDLVGVLLGDDVTELRVLTSHAVHPYAVDDGAVLAGRTRRGVLFSQHVSYNTPETLPRRRLEVIGTEGMLLAVDTMGQTAGGRLTHTDADGQDHDVPFDALTSPFAVQVERFGGAATGAAPWGYHLLRDLRLHRLLLSAAGKANELMEAT